VRIAIDGVDVLEHDIYRKGATGHGQDADR
jgi:hypothetical protein